MNSERQQTRESSSYRGSWAWRSTMLLLMLLAALGGYREAEAQTTSRTYDKSLVVRSVVLLDARTGARLQTLSSSQVVDLARFDSQEFNLLAVASRKVKSVRFRERLIGLDRVESYRPFTAFRELRDAPQEQPWRPVLGTEYSFTMLPFSQLQAAGNYGARRSVKIIFIDSRKLATVTPKPIQTVQPTAAPTFTPSPIPTLSPTATITATPRPTFSPTPRPTNTPTPRPTSTSSPSPTFTPTPRPTNTPLPTSTATPRSTATPLPTNTPTPRPTMTPVPSPTPVATCAPTPPANAVVVRPGDNFATIFAAQSAGTSYLLKAGEHRNFTVRPREGDAFYGEFDSLCRRLTKLNGSRLLTSFERSGSLWLVRGQTQEGQVHGSCDTGFPRCNRPEDLYINDIWLKPVDSIDQVVPGTWFFDYPNDTVYFADDPTGKKVEIGLTRVAIASGANNVKVVGLIVEKYSIPAQMGAIGDQYPGAGWHIEYNETRMNHGKGINAGTRAKLLRNYIHRNGQIGMGGVGDDILVEGNEVAYNLFNGTAMGWEGGGSKFAKTNRLILRNNCVHHNNGPGLWTDIENINTLIENNIVFENKEAGIFHEISYDATIRGNLVGNNARDGQRWLYGTQILISSSRNVVVSDNYVEVPRNANGISVLWQNRGAAYSGVNTQVRGNTVVYLTDSGLTGAAIDFDPGVPFFSTLSFNNNLYIVPNGSSRRWTFNGGNRTWSEFLAAGQESGGALQARTMTESAWNCGM